MFSKTKIILSIVFFLNLTGFISIYADKNCDVLAYASDTDPNGVNLRESAKGKVLTSIPDGSHISITAAKDGWFQIKSFEYMVETDAEKKMAKSKKHKLDAEESNVNVENYKAWIHGSRVSIHFSGWWPEVTMHTAPNEKSKVLFKFTNEQYSKPTQIISCEGKWFQVKVNGKVGWVDKFCYSSRTNCS